MGLFSLFELFLVLFTIYALFKYEGGTRILVPLLCLVAVYLFERLQGRMERLEECAEPSDDEFPGTESMFEFVDRKIESKSKDAHGDDAGIHSRVIEKCAAIERDVIA